MLNDFRQPAHFAGNHRQASRHRQQRARSQPFAISEIDEESSFMQLTLQVAGKLEIDPRHARRFERQSRALLLIARRRRRAANTGLIGDGAPNGSEERSQGVGSQSRRTFAFPVFARLPAALQADQQADGERNRHALKQFDSIHMRSLTGKAPALL